MDKPKLLDLFCCAGGASGPADCSSGYSKYFNCTGVDIAPQPHYQHRFIQADWLDYLCEHGHEYDAIHASPPCQKYSSMTRGRWKDREHPDLIDTVRTFLIKLGIPYVIENVPGAPLRNPVMLCGTMFGLQTASGSQLRRHRLFECSFPIYLEWGEQLYCRHKKSVSSIGVYGGGQHPDRQRIPATIGVYGHAGGSSRRDGLTQFGTDARREAMGNNWMTGDELSESIPHVYTEFLGKHLFKAVEQQWRR